MKRYLALLLALMLITGVAACDGNGAAPPEPQTSEAEAGPADTEEETVENPPILRIGALFALSGDRAAIGTDQKNATELWLDSRDGRIGPYEVELIFEDDTGSVDEVIGRVQNLIETEDVHILFGAATAEIGYAVGETAIFAGIPYIIPTVTADDMTQRRRHELLIRTGGTSSQRTHPFGHWAYRERGIRTVGTMAGDCLLGHEGTAGFVRTFEEAGGRVLNQVWTPPDSWDYTTFLDQIPREADALFLQYGSQDL
ncbi:MAG: ABC transporter substrate-binding protein, partial [Oscillospiraceae bacterium]|nr:ABC transporter substrate-binding protein [Oscillospiraceae bacterium]